MAVQHAVWPRLPVTAHHTRKGPIASRPTGFWRDHRTTVPGVCWLGALLDVNERRLLRASVLLGTAAACKRRRHPPRLSPLDQSPLHACLCRPMRVTWSSELIFPCRVWRRRLQTVACSIATNPLRQTQFVWIQNMWDLSRKKAALQGGKEGSTTKHSEQNLPDSPPRFPS